METARPLFSLGLTSETLAVLLTAVADPKGK